jgi:hypothetical protein
MWKTQSLPFIYTHWLSFVRFFLEAFAIFYADRRNDSSRWLLQRLPRPQHAGTPYNSIRHTCHLGSTSTNRGPTLLDFDDQMGTGMTNQEPLKHELYRLLARNFRPHVDIDMSDGS